MVRRSTETASRAMYRPRDRETTLNISPSSVTSIFVGPAGMDWSERVVVSAVQHAGTVCAGQTAMEARTEPQRSNVWQNERIRSNKCGVRTRVDFLAERHVPRDQRDKRHDDTNQLALAEVLGYHAVVIRDGGAHG